MSAVASTATPIAVFGDVCLHVVVRSTGVAGFAPGEVELAPGGSAAMVALQVAALGEPAEMFGVAGDDQLGTRLRSELRTSGVGCDSWVGVPGETAKVAVLVDAGDAGNDRDAGHRLVVDQGGVTEPGRALLEAGHRPARGALCYVPGFPAYDALRSWLVEVGARVVCDFGFRPWLSDLATARQNIVPRSRGVELAVCSGAGFADPINEALAEECRDNGARAVVTSLGARGAFVAGSEGVAYLPEFLVAVVNTLGAGDSLVAGLLVATARGQSLVEACRLGQAVAAAKISELVAPASPRAVEELLVAGAGAVHPGNPAEGGMR